MRNLPLLSCCMKIGLIKEAKIPADNRVALSPEQCKWIHQHLPGITVSAEASPTRCFSDAEYERAGVKLCTDMGDCDILLGIKEVPTANIIPDKTYLFFSHTKKLQPYNQGLFQTLIAQKNTLIDYECLTHSDGQRIIGFGFFAGIVGAHNGMMAFGNRTGLFTLDRVFKCKDYRQLIHTYFGLKLPNIKIAVTGSGRVAHGVLEVMNLLGIHEVEPQDYLHKSFDYPVYVHLKGPDLYRHKTNGNYQREDFHTHPSQYECCFAPFAAHTDILMNGVYWEKEIAPLFKGNAIQDASFRIQTIADITNDAHGSVPINLGDTTIEDPVYGVDRNSLQKTAPYLPNSIDIMAIGNLPNELPRDASRYFGEQLIKYVIPDLVKGGSEVIARATMLEAGKLTQAYDYMKAYAGL